MKRVLIISNSFFPSGAESSLSQFLNCYNSTRFKVFLVTSDKNYKISNRLNDVIILYMPLEWFCFTLNPIRLLNFLSSIIIVSCKLARIVNSNKIDIIYSNNIKSHIYGACLKLIVRKKLIWHVRDNVKKSVLTALLTRLSDKIICISQHIYTQVKAPLTKKIIIYGGIDTDEWNAFKTNNISLKEELGLSPETKLVAQIGQVTRWKNCLDFIEVARIINNQTDKVHFLFIGDDLSGKEGKYHAQLRKRVEVFNLNKWVTFLGYRKDIKDLISQIDVIVHTAINEPFGRVIIEAMALEKPVISYNGGGPDEIIVDNDTGFLVPLFNTKIIAEKTLILLNNNLLATKLGKAGRERIIKEFNIKKSIFQLEEVFGSML